MLTPQSPAPKLAKAIGLDVPLYIKREDLNPYGSHKGRSIPLMMEKYAAQGVRDFVISSSGNAALAAAKYVVQRPELKLTIFVGKNIDNKKLTVIASEAKQSQRISEIRGIASSSASRRTPRNDRVIVKQVANPKQAAFQMNKAGKAKNLRQSTDDSALVGYEELARELAEVKNLAAVFVPTSSGTTAQGLYLGFGKLGVKPQIHIIQTSACHPFIQNTKYIIQNTKYSLASAIVDKVAHRKSEIVKLLKNSHGAGWVASDEEIRAAMALIKKTEGINASPNSALALAGLVKALAAGEKFSGPVVCLFTGL